MSKPILEKSVQAMMQTDEKNQLDSLAKAKGLSTSKLARIYITKGMEADTPPPTPETLVQEGLAPNLEAAQKLFDFLKPRGV